jgi:tripeptidyl-peptidase-2
MKPKLLTWISPALVTIAASAAFGESPVKAEQEALIPKRETGVLEFLKKHPEFDGRGTIIAVFDTGVDPAAAGLQKTSIGERKIVDVIDATGSGDVDTSHTVEASKEGTFEGLTGRTLTLPKKIHNPAKKFHLGIKRAKDLFHGGVNKRISRLRSEAWQRELNLIKDRRAEDRRTAEKKGERSAFKKTSVDLSLKEKDEIAREQLLESLEKDFASSDPGPIYDCVVWSDGKQFHVIVDTDEDGDLADEKILQPFGVAGDYGTLSEEEASTFAVQVYEKGNLLSIVTVSGSHGSHVSSIAAAHFPDAPHRDGVAPGARILSIKIGDTRMGGSSSGVGEMRGVAACVQYEADIMNASWGGASQYQDGQDSNAQLYNLLVEKYGVSGFVSAGNSGPALSTLGSPGGEATSIIGVGAYVSSGMARILYSQTSEAPSTAYNFSARGPCKNGDLGVDIMGPGGAHASLAYDELRNSQRYHGTSMSAPSVAGLGALLVSAAKQSGIEHSPARIRAALMNSAHFVENVEVFAQGAGLVQALPAWEHLKKSAKQSEWDHFYTVNTRNNTFRSGPGLYLRGDIPVGKKEIRFDISPKFSAHVKAPEKFKFENDLVFSATQPWVKIPGYARLGNGQITIRPVLDIPESKPGQPIYAEIHGHLADSPGSGPLVRIPITIVRGEKTDPHTRHRADFSLELKSGATHRRFYQVPGNANFLKVRLRRDHADPLRRAVILHAVTLVADGSYYSFNSQEYLSLDSGGEKVVMIPVAPGKTTELAFHQPYFSVGKTTVDVDLQFIGLTSDQEVLVLHENNRHVPLRVVSASDETVRGEGSIEVAHFSKLPEKTAFLSPDKRDEFPPGPHQEGVVSPPYLQQIFTVLVEKPTKIKLEPARQFNASSEIEGGLVTAIHESGKTLYQGTTSRNSSVSLPKGKTTFHRILRSLNRGVLELEKDRPLAWSMKLEKPKKLELFESMREVMKGRSAGTLTLQKGRHHSLMVGASGLASLSSHKPAPSYFSGSFKLKQDGDGGRELLEVRVECRPGEDFKSVTNQKKKPESLEAKKSVLKTLDDELFQRRLDFVKANKFNGDKKIVATRDEILAQLLNERPWDAAVHIVHAQVHAGKAKLLGEMPKLQKRAGKKVAAKGMSQVQTILKKARRLSKPKAVAIFFGAQTDDEEASLDQRKEASAKQKKMESRRKNLATIALHEAEILLRAGKPKPARRALRELRRWQDQPSKEHKKIEYELLEKENLHGLALQKLNELLKESPFDKKLLEDKAALFGKLGFDKRFIQRLRLARKVREQGARN